MKVVRTTDGLATELLSTRGEDCGRIGFVPTMGALHEGHLSLLRAARARCDLVVMSVFVNPLQFGPAEDLASYPRNDKKDLTLAEQAGVDVVFLPTVEEMFPEAGETTVSVGRIGTIVEGSDRPGHFDGVATIVAKLFNIVRPDVAYFGQKDAQQVAVIRQLVRDLSYDVEIVVEPTVRDADGLALSSRNAYLSPDERERATVIYRALLRGAQTLEEEGPEAAEKNMWEALVEGGLDPSYARAVDPVTFGPPADEGPMLLVIAARLGSTRLIDNMLVDQRRNDA